MAYSSANMIKGKRSGESRYNEEQTRTLRDGQEEWANPNIDASMPRTHALQVVFSRNAENVKDAIDSRIAEVLGDKRLRKDAVTHLPFFATMPDYSKRSEAERAEFANRVYAFLEKRFGAMNIVDMRWHFDESAPHLHSTIVPITEDGRLCAKEMFKATKPGMMKFQREYYAEVAEPMGYDKPDFGKSKEKGYTKETIATREQLEAVTAKRNRAEAALVAEVGKLKGLQTDVAEKQALSANLDNQNSEKTAELNDLKAEIAVFSEKKSAVAAEFEAEKQRLDERLEYLRHRNAPIESEYQQLKNEEQDLRAENQRLAADSGAARRDKRFAEEYNRLGDREYELIERNESLRELVEELIDKVIAVWGVIRGLPSEIADFLRDEFWRKDLPIEEAVEEPAGEFGYDLGSVMSNYRDYERSRRFANDHERYAPGQQHEKTHRKDPGWDGQGGR